MPLPLRGMQLKSLILLQSHFAWGAATSQPTVLHSAEDIYARCETAKRESLVIIFLDSPQGGECPCERPGNRASIVLKKGLLLSRLFYESWFASELPEICWPIAKNGIQYKWRAYLWIRLGFHRNAWHFSMKIITFYFAINFPLPPPNKESVHKPKKTTTKHRIP